MNVANWLHQTAHVWPDRPAILSGTRCFADYAAMRARTAGTARAMRDLHGVAAGDRVAIFAGNCPEYLILVNAVWWLGATVIPVNGKLHPSEAAWILQDAEAKLVVTGTGDVFAGMEIPAVEISVAEAASAEPLADGEELSAPAEQSPEDVAWLFYTSGTTGKPKGVMLTHDNLLHMTLCYGTDVDAITADQTALYAAPMSHGAGLYSLVFTRAGASHLVPESGGFDPAEIIDLAREIGELSFFAAPTMVKRLIEKAAATGYRGEGIRTIVYGGGPMYVADLEAALRQFGPRFVQIYGQGESPMTITALSRDLVADGAHPASNRRRQSVGVAQSCIELRVLDESSRPLTAGRVGEVAVRGPTVMKGYWRRPDATRETLREGWLMTGDLGYMDGDGFLYLTDRSKDLIISGGSNVYPREVEEVLLQFASVAEAAVIGAPDPEWGEIVVAFLVPAPGHDVDQAALDAFCRENIARFKRPKQYRVLAALPKNNYGKVLKTALREMLAAES